MRSRSRASSRGGRSSVLSPKNSTTSSAPGSPCRKSRRRSKAGFPRVWSRMNLSMTSTAAGWCSRIAGVAASASSRWANSMDRIALALGKGIRRILASTMTPSVPSEPTIRSQRLNLRSGRTNASRLYPPTRRRIFGNRRSISSAWAAASSRTTRVPAASKVSPAATCSTSSGERECRWQRVPSASTTFCSSTWSMVLP